MKENVSGFFSEHSVFNSKSVNTYILPSSSLFQPVLYSKAKIFTFLSAKNCLAARHVKFPFPTSRRLVHPINIAWCADKETDTWHLNYALSNMQ